MKTVDKHFADWMYPYDYDDDEQMPATEIDDKVRDFHDYIEDIVREAYKAGFKQGYANGVDKALNDD